MPKSWLRASSPASVIAYGLVEALLGRALAWRIGRWLYLGSRRESVNDPNSNGEYLLQRAWAKSCVADRLSGAVYQVVDVGANVGAWSRNLINEFESAGFNGYHILAFEPAPAQRASLSAFCRDAILAGRMSLDTHGLGADRGQRAFRIVDDLAGTNSLAALGCETVAGETIEIDITTLDAICAEGGISRLQFVKVDTEGNDFNVILGAHGLFDREAIEILQFEYNWRWVAFGHFLRHVFNFLEGRPYRLGRLTCAGIEFYETWHPELERFIETNYVIAHHNAVRDLPHWRAAFDDCNTAVRIRDH